MPVLTRDFYNRPAVDVAKDLLGCRLVRMADGARMAGIITETEAYQGEDDLGCHAHVGKTARNAQMYAQPGHAYIYFTYGMHWLLNVVTSPECMPAAVLIRAILPVEGCARMAVNRPKLVNKPGWLNGPAKLCQALGLSGAQNGQDLCQEQGLLSIESGSAIPPAHIRTDARVGSNSVPEPWKSIPWRFRVDADLLGVSAC